MLSIKIYKFIGAGVFLFSCLIVLFFCTSLIIFGKKSTLNTESCEFIIKQGESLNRVIENLYGLQLVEKNIFLKYYILLQQHSQYIKVGEYCIPPKLSYKQLAAMLNFGQECVYSIRISEGATAAQAIEQLNQHPKLQLIEAGKSLSDRLKLQDNFPECMNNLEGMLFPDTYTFTAKTKIWTIIFQAHEKLIYVLTQKWQNRDLNLPYTTPYEVLIMASLIEKETGDPAERADIAGVFIRRLQKKMFLQTDPSVIYGLGSQFKGKLNKVMLQQLTPYNTYKRRGLPPSPIALVTEQSIHAALHPSKGDTLYFVAKGDGTHHFSSTLEEHNIAVQKYQIKERAEDYRSTNKPTK